MALANNFITERNNSEVIAVGLNSIREICARCPLSMTDDLLGDLVQYRSYKDKAVSYAAKSIIQLFREKNPQMLHRRMRGKPTEESAVEGAKMKQYGELDAKTFIPGAEIVDFSDVEEDNKDSDDEEDEDGWVEASDDEDEDEDEAEAGGEKEEENKTRSKSKKRKHSEDEDDDSEEEWVNVSSEDDDAVDDSASKEGEPEKRFLLWLRRREKRIKFPTKEY